KGCGIVRRAGRARICRWPADRTRAVDSAGGGADARRRPERRQQRTPQGIIPVDSQAARAHRMETSGIAIGRACGPLPPESAATIEAQGIYQAADGDAASPTFPCRHSAAGELFRTSDETDTK